MPAENPREPRTLPEPARTAEPEATPGDDADRTAPHQPADAAGTVPEAAVPMLLSDPAWPQVSGYEVTGEIARGGMGVVYAARDLSLRREVAVKTLLPNLATDPRFVAHFDREAGLTASLQHPGVPPVHALGTLEDGRPFLAMKLIRGRTLAEELANTDRVVSLPRLLGVFEQICQTVGYAHAQGVIHRDLKPSNVMVGAFGEVQVMDWGIARRAQNAGSWHEEASSGAATQRTAAAEAEATRAGQAKGTPAYMPPEQARGEWGAVDARADVFALGGILCMLLTGRPPYTGTSAADALGKAKAAELAGALAALDACGADAELVALCKQCLAPNPSDRPADGSSAAVAVATYRAGVEERRARRAETQRAAAEAEAREQRKRRKVQLALAAAVVTIAGLFATGAVWNERTKVRAESACARTEGLLELAEQLRRDYRYRDADTAIRQAGELAERFAPDLADRVERAEADLAFVRELDAIRMKRSTWVSDGAGRGHFDTSGAPQAYQRAFAARGLDVAADPERVAEWVAASAVRADLMAALDDWAVLLPERDAALRDRVLAAVRLADPDSGANVLRDAGLWKDKARLRSLASQTNAARLSPGAVVAVGVVMFEQGLDPAPLLRQGVSLYPRDFLLVFTLGQVLRTDDPEGLGAFRAARALRPDNIAVLTNLGHALHDQGDLDGAIACHREAIRLEPGYAAAHTGLGIILREKGDLDGAIARHREAIRLEPEFAGAYMNLSRALSFARDREGAVAAAREAIRLSPELPSAYLSLEAALQAQGDFCGAVFALEEAIRVDPGFAPAYLNLGNILRDQGDLDGAVAALREAVRLDPGFAAAHSNLGLVLCDMKDLEGAVAAHRECLRISPKLAPAHVNFGITLRARKELDAAIATYREAIRLDPLLVQAHVNLGHALRDKKDWEGAIAAYRDTLRLSPEDAGTQYNLGLLLQDKQDLAGAVAAYREAIRLKPDYAEAHTNLGLALLDGGDSEGAIAEYNEAIRINPRLVQAHYNLGFARVRRQDLDGAIAAWREVTRLEPDHADAYTNLGAALQQKGELDEAIVAHREAIRLKPGAVLPHGNLGNALRAKGDADGAVAECRKAVDLEPNNPAYHNSLGLALVAGKNLDGAAAAFREAARLDPRDAVAAYNAGSAYYQQKKYAEALPWSREAVRRGAKYANAHAMLGLCLQQTGDIAGARATFEAATGLDPGRFGRLLAKLPVVPVAPPPREVRR